MKNIRIGNDINIKWTITRLGEAEDFSSKNVSVYLLEPFSSSKADINYTISGNVIDITFFGKDQRRTGIYTLKLVENDGLVNMNTLDHCDAFNLVGKSCMVGGSGSCSNIEVESIQLEDSLDSPANGESAYQIALKTGFEGTEEEWIASLKGEKGDRGEKGEQGIKGDTGETGSQGPKGESYDDTKIVNDIAALSQSLSLVQNALNTLLEGNVSEAIESFNEVIAFLEGVEDTQSLSGIIASIEQQIAGKQDSIDDLNTIRSGASKGATSIQGNGTVTSIEFVEAAPSKPNPTTLYLIK